jgi:hypothetical protein
MAGRLICGGLNPVGGAFGRLNPVFAIQWTILF